MGRSHRPRPARLGVKLRQIRCSLELTLEQMIERLGYTDSPLYPTNISGMERAEREPPLLLLLAYARAAGVSTDMLIDDDLDLPTKLPGRTKHEGVKRTATAKRQK
jgi:transcriptional regulator with XRE-family HTH domain